MKKHRRFLPVLVAAALALLLLGSCADKEKDKEAEKSAAESEMKEKQSTVIEPALLPSRFRQAGYMIKDESAESAAEGGKDAGLEEFQLKVGANITTNEPIPLREAMKAIVRNKNMSLSWAPDVDQDLFVDIDVSPNDNFYEAIDNILRQLDYFHEVEGDTLIIKYRETKQYHIAMPFTKQDYETGTGGNLLGSDSEVSKSTKGVIRLDSKGNTFDLWDNIDKNIKTIIDTWSSTATKPEAEAAKPAEGGEKGKNEKAEPAAAEAAQPKQSRRVSSTASSYTIDKPVGLITVHAPKSLQMRIENYLATLEKEIYKQIMIEAKVIEVQLQDNSSLGINWNTLLKNLSFVDSYIVGDKYYGKKTDETDDKSKSSSKDYQDSTENSSTSTSKDSKIVDGVLKKTDYTNTEGEEPRTDKSGHQTEDETTTDTSTTENSNESKSTRTITDVLTKGTSAATTLATLVTGYAQNNAYGGVLLSGFSFDSFINALKEQGQTSILSNPKISVMNGQPALITVGRNVTYVDSVETEVDKKNGTINYKIKTERILSGMGLALSAVVKRNNEIVMNLVPVTSELVDEENIKYLEIGSARVGLPVVNIREMSTTVTIKDGSMLVVGGLISEVDSKDGDFLYGTENIPYLKYLFGYEEKRKTKRELIVLLRPRIIN